MKTRIGTVFVLIVLSGCVSIHTALYPDSNFSPTNPKNVQVLKDFPPDPSTYRVMGEFATDEGLGDLLTDSIFQNRLRKKVATLGADAVVLFAEHSNTYALTTPAKSSTHTDHYATISGPTISGHSNATTTYTPPQTTYIEGHVGKGYLIKYLRK